MGAAMLVLLRSLTYGQSLQSVAADIAAHLPIIEILKQRIDGYNAQPAVNGDQELTELSLIEFSDVCFEYVTGTSILRGASFQIRPGQTVGIAGRSGTGKTTLIELLLGVREPTNGTIRANGTDLHNIDRTSWSSLVAFVCQDPLVISGSIADNVRFFREEISDREILDALLLAGLDIEVASMPNGIDALVGERGSGLSGGQRQRLSIARALVGSPRLLVLDEPTAALDSRSEQTVVKTLQRYSTDAMVVIVAHRPTTLAVCDQVMVVHDGLVTVTDDLESLGSIEKYFNPDYN